MVDVQNAYLAEAEQEKVLRVESKQSYQDLYDDLLPPNSSDEEERKEEEEVVEEDGDDR